MCQGNTLTSSWHVILSQFDNYDVKWHVKIWPETPFASAKASSSSLPLHISTWELHVTRQWPYNKNYGLSMSTSTMQRMTGKSRRVNGIRKRGHFPCHAKALEWLDESNGPKGLKLSMSDHRPRCVKGTLFLASTIYTLTGRRNRL